MIIELGHFATILALVTVMLGAVVPLAGAALGQLRWLELALPAARIAFVLLAVGFGCLIFAFVDNDFSVIYVANNSSTDLPLLYRVTATWGAHEGSLHMWALILAGWTAAVSFAGSAIPRVVLTRVLAILCLLNCGFLLLELLTSNPFIRSWPEPAVGRELNPLLQDFGLAVHPPMLYMGYVGFAVAFAFAIEALLGGRVDAAWVRWMRPWTNCAWACLSVGIALGSWWAYYELGWGGWWFWDPVENASFMPWLVGAALVHSMAATEKRGLFKSWTVLLAILAFSLSLLGMFLVRSGVLTSVHAFATDPTRGVVILALLVLTVGGSLTLYAVRVSKLQGVTTFTATSRETALLLNNMFWVACAGTILVGTLYPLALDALGAGKISVGPSYFNVVFVIMTGPLVVLVAAGTAANWKRDRFVRIAAQLRLSLVGALLGALTPLLMTTYVATAAVGASLAGWVLGAIVRDLLRQPSLRKVRLVDWGMHLAHGGMAVFVCGVTFVSVYGTARDMRMDMLKAQELAGYEFSLLSVAKQSGPNYQAIVGTVEVRRNGQLVSFLQPEKRTYASQQNPLTEAAISPGFWRDVYVSLGEQLAPNAWSMRVQVKPLIRWIWLGVLLMAAGGVLAACDPRYRAAKPASLPPSA